MREFLLIILTLVTLSACATTTTMTPCQKAQLGFVQSSAALQTPFGGTESNYWVIYKTGAKESVLRDCME
jgi:hypothetical protein